MSNSQQLNNMGDWANAQAEPANANNQSASGYSYGNMGLDATSP